MRRKSEIAMPPSTRSRVYKPGPLDQCSGEKIPKIRCSWGGPLLNTNERQEGTEKKTSDE